MPFLELRLYASNLHVTSCPHTPFSLQGRSSAAQLDDCMIVFTYEAQNLSSGLYPKTTSPPNAGSISLSWQGVKSMSRQPDQILTMSFSGPRLRNLIKNKGFPHQFWLLQPPSHPWLQPVTSLPYLWAQDSYPGTDAASLA